MELIKFELAKNRPNAGTGQPRSFFSRQQFDHRRTFFAPTGHLLFGTSNDPNFVRFCRDNFSGRHQNFLLSDLSRPAVWHKEKSSGKLPPFQPAGITFLINFFEPGRCSPGFSDNLFC